MSFSVDFRPRKDGQPYDPATFGGSVDLLRVYNDAARQTLATPAVGPAVRILSGLYRFTVPNLPDGTYYTSITWTESAGAVPFTDLNDRFTLPVPDPVIARLRRLIAEPTSDTYTDGDLSRTLDENTSLGNRVDVYAAAADIWEEKAAALAGAAADNRSVSSISTGDQRIVYSVALPGTQAVDFANKQARYYRSKSSARTVRLVAPGVNPRLMRPEQYDAGIGHLGAEALYLAGVEDE